jgi:hypothetical protein
MKDVFRVAAFLVLRMQWYVACRAVEVVHWISKNLVPLPGWVYEVVGRVLGTRWAFRLMRQLGWSGIVTG